MSDRVKLYIAALISGTMIFLSFPSFNLYLLIWFALVPAMVLSRNVKPVEALYTGMIVMFVAVCGGVSWLNYLALHYIGIPYPLNKLAIVFYAGYISILGGLIFWLSHLIFRLTRVPYFIVFPLVFVSLWRIYPMLFYFKFGDSQFYFKTAIQPVEYLGIYGLDFMIVLTNALIAEFVIDTRRFFRSTFNIVGAVVVIGWFVLGAYRYAVWDKKLSTWNTEKIAIVQPNRPINSGINPVLRPVELEMSVIAAKKGAKAAVWPEGAFLGVDYFPEIRNEFVNTAKKHNIALIINDRSKSGDPVQDEYVSAFMIKPDKNIHKYDKRVLVPFGETLPFNSILRPLSDQLALPVPNFKPGSAYKYFPQNGIRFTPLICYENTFPEYSAGAVGSDGAGKVFVFQSQDGWYGSSQQAETHLNVSFMRAVENRIPAIHVINNGYSGSVTPHGRMITRTGYAVNELKIFELPVNKLEGGSFYSRYPNLFTGTVIMVTLLLGLYAFIEWRIKKQHF